MKKEFIKIGVALIVLFGLAIPLSLYRGKKMEKAVSEDRSNKFITFDLEKLERMQIANKSGEVEIQKRKQDATGKFEDEFNSRDFEFKDKPKWIVTKPFRALADSMQIESILSQIKDLGYQKTIQDTQDLKKDYELDPAVFSIKFYDSNASEPKLILNMGSENPAATAFYFSTSDKPGIYLGERVLQPYKNQDIQEWREKRMLGFSNPADIEKIVVQRLDKKEESFATTVDNKVWKIEPVADNLVADTVALNEFITHIDGMRSDKIMDNPSVLHGKVQLGEVRMMLKNRKEPFQFKVFAGTKDSNEDFVQRSDLKEVFMIRKDPKMLPSFQSFVDKHLLQKSLNEISFIKMIRPSGNIEVEKIKDVWRVKVPFDDEANVRRLDSFLQVIADMKPDLYLKNKMLNEKNRQMRVEFKFDDQTKREINFYRDGNEFFAKIEDGSTPRVVRIPQIPAELEEHLSKIRNNELIPVAEEHVKRIVFSFGKARAEIQRNEKHKNWYLKSLSNVSSAVNMKWKEERPPVEFFDRLSEIYISKFMNKMDPAEKYDVATLEIFSDQDKQYTWNFGPTKNGMISVFSPERQVVGIFPSLKFEELVEFFEEPKKQY